MDYSSLPSDELVSLCSASQDLLAWREFVRRFQRPIALVIYRVARLWGESGTSIVDDLVQETFLKLCANDCSILREFRAKHTEASNGYLRVIALNVAHDYFRSRRAVKRGGSQRQVDSEVDPLEFTPAAWGNADQIEREIQLKELDHLLDAASEVEVSTRDRVIFRLYYKQGLTAKAIASIPSFQLSTKGVESSLARTARFLKLQVQGNQPYRSNPSQQGLISTAPPEENL